MTLFVQIVVFFAEGSTEAEEESHKDACLDDALESQIRVVQIGVFRNDHYNNATDEDNDRQD